MIVICIQVTIQSSHVRNYGTYSYVAVHAYAFKDLGGEIQD